MSSLGIGDVGDEDGWGREGEKTKSDSSSRSSTRLARRSCRMHSHPMMIKNRLMKDAPTPKDNRRPSRSIPTKI